MAAREALGDGPETLPAMEGEGGQSWSLVQAELPELPYPSCHLHFLQNI